jgi:adenylosuccinate synthase
MKADVLSGFETLQVATQYQYQGKIIEHLPFDVLSGELKPIYREFKGWNKDLTGLSKMEEMPAEFHEYLNFIETALDVPIKIVSVGPDRKQTIIRH